MSENLTNQHKLPATPLILLGTSVLLALPLSGAAIAAKAEISEPQTKQEAQRQRVGIPEDTQNWLKLRSGVISATIDETTGNITFNDGFSYIESSPIEGAVPGATIWYPLGDGAHLQINFVEDLTRISSNLNTRETQVSSLYNFEAGELQSDDSAEEV